MRYALRASSIIATVLFCLYRSVCGDQFFSQQPIWSSGTTKSGGDGIARFVDFDRDGDLDFVTSAPNPMRWVLYQNEDGKIAKTPSWESDKTTDCDHIDMLDFNQDGWMDLAATHESHCTLYLNQRGKFHKSPDWETGMIANANQIDFGDFDQDGDYDMVMAGGEPVNGVALFENTTGTPAKKPTQKLGHTEYSETAIFADLDGDGDLDIVAGYRGGKTVLFTNTDGSFDDGTIVYEDKDNAWTQRLYLRDLDSDGHSELFCAKGPWGNSLGMSLQLVRQDAEAEMKPRWQSAADSAFHGFDFQDVDQDGAMDVLAADYANGGQLALYLSNGGELSDEPAWTVKTSGPAHEAVLGDIDGDGDLDLAVGCRDQAHIYESRTAQIRRAKSMLTAKLVFQPSVFTGGEFPQCDFLKPAELEGVLGEYDIDVEYYWKDRKVVEQPAAPGRYGAIVTITAEDGSVYTRFRTLYKSPERVSLFYDRLQGELKFPSSTGVVEQTWQNQRRSVNDFVGRAIGRDIRRSHDFAILLAGMDEIGPTAAPVSHYEDAVTKDRQWWLKLKRKLNGNEERFAKEFVAPRVVEGLNARVLKLGSEEDAGMQAGTIANLDEVLNEWSNDSDQPFNVCVARHGVVFYHKAYGSRAGEPITTDTKHIVFSISKALSGSLLMMFVDQGLVSLDDPVQNYLPEFEGRGGEKTVTVHHLFTHTADMEGHFTDFWNDLEHVYGEAYPYLAIGERHKYNGTSIGVGLKVLEQLTGLTLPELYKKHLFDPLDCESIESIDGSAMTWSNAHDLARVGQMLANHGAYGNKRFFGEDVFQQMLPRKLDELLGDDTTVTWGIGLTWFTEGGLSDRTIGHGSASSCTLRVDLEKDLVITMTRATAGENFKKYHPKFIEAVTGNVAD